MKLLAVIPARYDSSRFPGKPLVMIGDRPMVQRVYEVARACDAFDKVVVATDSEKIAACVRGFGGAVEMTSSVHETGTDRVAEVAARYPEMDAIANVQGDQPFATTEMLDQLMAPYLAGQSPDMTTLACPLTGSDPYNDPNTVKVLCDRNNQALYFSRASIPFVRKPPAEGAPKMPVYHHLGLYAFRRDFLAHYAKLEPTPFEQCEALEQLRVLEHGYRIVVCQTAASILEINTPEDLAKAKSTLALV